MINVQKKYLPWIFLGILSCVAFFLVGYYMSTLRHDAEVGERALANFHDGVSALGYLEKGDIPNTRKMIQIMVEGNLITSTHYGTPYTDTATDGGYKNSLFVHYRDIRAKYPPIEYSDGGAMNHEVEAILATGSTKPKSK